jgi:hypothetical protein
VRPLKDQLKILTLLNQHFFVHITGEFSYRTSRTIIKASIFDSIKLIPPYLYRDAAKLSDWG